MAAQQLDMKHTFKYCYVIILSFLSFSTGFASTITLDGNWLDAENNKTAIVQSDSKVILTSQTVKMNGTIDGKKITITVNSEAMTGVVSDDNMTITWSNGNQWYRDISGTWKKGNVKYSVEQIGNIVRIKNAKGVIEYVGFVKENGITLIEKTSNSATNGSLLTKKEIKWSDGSKWTK